jgi:hypothetical protein
VAPSIINEKCKNVRFYSHNWKNDNDYNGCLVVTLTVATLDVAATLKKWEKSFLGIKGIELLDRKDLKLTPKNIGGFGKKKSSP